MQHTNSEPNDEAGKRLKSIIDTAIDGIVTIDQNGIIEKINPAAARLFGYEIAELTGEKINRLMPPQHAMHHDGYISNYLETGKAKIIGIGREVEGKKKDGTTFPIRLAVSEINLGNKKIFTGIIHDLSEVKIAEKALLKLNEELENIVEDRTKELEEVINKLLHINERLEHEISERKQAEIALRKSQGELKNALEKEKELGELKSRFVSMASHEFRTPLSTILSSAALIKRYTSEETQSKREKHIRRIKSTVSNLTGILNDFLSLSKIDEGIITAQKDSFYISDLCHEIIDEVQGLLLEGQKIFYQDTTNHKPIFTDERILKNILYNLVTNAIKYSPPHKSIHMIGGFENNRFSIAVKDEGMGIPLNEQKHLFSRFFRASNAMNIQGTGLGLNIVKSYVDLLNGEISFVSQENKGTTFTIYLPS